MNQKLLLVLVLFLLSTCVILVKHYDMKYVMFDKAMIGFAILVFLVVLMYSLFKPKAKTHKETFECMDESRPQEDTTDINSLSKLIYESVFGPQPVEGSNWGSISMNQYGSVEQIPDEKHIARLGIPLRNRSLSSRNADSLGLTSSSMFTMAIAVRFNSFEGFESSDVTTETIFEIPCSTIEPNPIPYVMKLDVSPGTAIEGTTNKNIGLSFSVADSTVEGETIVDMDKAYMILVTRQGQGATTKFFELTVGALDGNLKEGETVSAIAESTEGLSMSNQPIKINTRGMLNCQTYAVALFDRGLNDSQERTLQQYWSMRIREATNPGARNPGDCPYGRDVCANQYCSGISDWSKPELIIDSRSECKDVVDDFCKNNPEHPSCYCWNPEDTRSTGEDCMRWKAFIQRTQCKDLNALTEDDLEFIKEKYKQVFKCCASDEDETKKPEKKSPIINYYEEKEQKDDGATEGGDDSSSSSQVNDYYKVPSISSDGDVSSPPDTSSSSSGITNPYSPGQKYDSPYFPRSKGSSSTSNRMNRLHDITYHDRWSTHAAEMDTKTDTETNHTDNETGMVNWFRKLMNSNE
ncbi:hypothetical protein TetV_656 [Tetraselmis virus 1]|uniref:Uncharacterized protein n=1 Tax=Tetraselmis virus 1 TaxID=2060617 RepID=A0A2P0VP99_9VIRU|nr:hypothetical protein QJ968_gp398 [Tetraselmis virus 1]AUF82738.1 hypothetical protein TetV_656 [Tetraselmis virus 1]